MPRFKPVRVSFSGLKEPFSGNLKAGDLASCHSLLVDCVLKGARELDEDGRAVLVRTFGSGLN